jgi:hypothetical protein
VSSDGGSERVVARPDSTKGQSALGWPEMLPGGKTAAITILHGQTVNTDSLYLGFVNLEKGEVSELGIRGLTPHFALGHLLWVRADGQLVARPFDPKKGVFIGAERAVARDVSVRGSHGSDFSIGFTDLAVSDNGLVMFTDGGPFRLSNGGGAGRRSIVRRVGRRTAADFLQVPMLSYESVRISPDGAMLALEITDSAHASRKDIYVYTFATGNLKQLTRDGKSERPVWTPDGKRIVFRVADRAAKPMIRWFSQPWDESEPVKPIEGADGAEMIEYDPKGMYIAMVRGDSVATESEATNSDIYLAPIDSPGVAKPFAATGIRERMPRFSPNGKWMAYVGHEIPSTSGGAPTSVGRIYVRAVPGNGAVYTVSTTSGFMPMWSRDGKTLYYFENPGAYMAAHIAESPQFTVTSVTPDFSRAGPGTGPASPTALWTHDIFPDDGVLYLTTATPPVGFVAGSGRGGPINPATVTATLDSYSPNLIAIFNWLGAQPTERKP